MCIRKSRVCEFRKVSASRAVSIKCVESLEEMMESYVFMVVLAAIGLLWLSAKMKRVSNLNAWLDAKGVALDHNYYNVLGMDKWSEQVFLYTDAAYLLRKNQIRSVEKSSILESRYNIYGMGFHKDKECRLVIHTTSFYKQLHVIGFDSQLCSCLRTSRSSYKI